MRGEHETTVPFDIDRKGSSPHARGAQRLDVQSVLIGGIIPACAGSTGQHCMY